MRASYLFTSESVSEGHPDKVCDRISDEIVDLFYREGPKAGIDPWQIRAACETLATTNKVVIAGETRGPESVTNEQIENTVREAIPKEWINGKTICHSNPTGKFFIGRPDGDSGLTGRKIIVDTYGGAAPHGGGAFSGKDPTKVDRSAAYAARYVAKNIVAAGLAARAQIQVAYAIGVAHPMSVLVETFGTESIPVERIEEVVAEHFDLRPGAILRDLDLRRPIYAKTAAYGHFGRDDHDFTWERTDKADTLREAAGLASELEPA